jgi:hypothetical protein
MTNSNNPLIDPFARAMIDNLDADAMLDMIDSLATRLPERDFNALCNAIELCPMHRCDYRICADDNITECADIR